MVRSVVHKLWVHVHLRCGNSSGKEEYKCQLQSCRCIDLQASPFNVVEYCDQVPMIGINVRSVWHELWVHVHLRCGNSSGKEEYKCQLQSFNCINLQASPFNAVESCNQVPMIGINVWSVLHELWVYVHLRCGNSSGKEEYKCQLQSCRCIDLQASPFNAVQSCDQVEMI